MRTRVPLVFLMLLAAGCSSGSKTATVRSSSTPTPQATTPPATPTSAGATAGTSALKIAGFAYDPTPLTVATGAKVAVTNADSAEHTVTSDMAGLFLADDVKNGKTVTFTAPTKAGTYTFHCRYHASMHGTLVVKG